MNEYEVYLLDPSMLSRAKTINEVVNIFKNSEKRVFLPYSLAFAILKRKVNKIKFLLKALSYVSVNLENTARTIIEVFYPLIEENFTDIVYPSIKPYNLSEYNKWRKEKSELLFDLGIAFETIKSNYNYALRDLLLQEIAFLQEQSTIITRTRKIIYYLKSIGVSILNISEKNFNEHLKPLFQKVIEKKRQFGEKHGMKSKIYGIISFYKLLDLFGISPTCPGVNILKILGVATVVIFDHAVIGKNFKEFVSDAI